MPASIGAYSLILTYPEACLAVEGIEGQGSQDEILWKAGEGRLALAWYSLKPLDAGAGDILFSIRAKVRSALSPGQPALGLLRRLCDQKLSRWIGYSSVFRR